MMTISILFFANLREITGTKEFPLDIPVDTTVAGLKILVVEFYPSLAPHMESVLVSVNKEYGFDEDVIPDGAEVAFFPPVSGGNETKIDFPIHLAIQDEELDLNELVQQITTARTGAACVFTGMVRAITEKDDPHTTEY